MISFRQSYFFWFYFLVLPLFISCDRDPPPPLPGNIVHPSSMVIASDRLFVTSLASDSLRVIDLNDGGFIRAPNPLFALELPAVRRPYLLHKRQAITQGERDLVFVFSAVDPQMRVMDAQSLLPLGRPIELPGRVVAADYSAEKDALYIVVHSPDDSNSPGALIVSSLTQEAIESDALVPPDEPPLKIEEIIPLDFLPGGLALSEDESHLKVWISDLFEPRLFYVDFSLDESETGEIHTRKAFRTLHSSPKTSSSDESAEYGRHVYALSADGKSLLGIDGFDNGVFDAQIIEDMIQPMDLPAVGVDFTVVSDVMVDLGPDAEASSTFVDSLILVSLLDGRILYVDGTRMIPLDLSGRVYPEPYFELDPPLNLVGTDGVYTTEQNWAAPVLTHESNPSFEAGGMQPPLIPLIDLNPGLSRNRIWRISWRGEISHHSPASAVLDMVDGEISLILEGGADLRGMVLSGDIVEFAKYELKSQQTCGDYESFESLVWEIGFVHEDSPDSIVLTEISGGPPLPSTDCFQAEIVIRLRAGSYMVRADGLDEYWRLEPGEIFEYRGERFLRTVPELDAPELRFGLAEIQDISKMRQGAERRIIVRSGFEEVMAIPDTALLGVAKATMIGRPLLYSGNDAKFLTDTVFVPYAGPGYLLSFDLRSRGSQQAHQ